MGHMVRLCLTFHRRINIFQELLLYFSPYEVFTSVGDYLPCQGEKWRHDLPTDNYVVIDHLYEFLLETFKLSSNRFIQTFYIF